MRPLSIKTVLGSVHIKCLGVQSEKTKTMPDQDDGFSREEQCKFIRRQAGVTLLGCSTRSENLLGDVKRKNGIESIN